MRIWPVGSSRLLGVVPAENEITPNNVKGLVSFNRDVFAVLKVCPFTQERPGEMQLVCVEAAENVQVLVK